MGHEDVGEIIESSLGAFQAPSTNYPNDTVAGGTRISQIPNSPLRWTYQTIPQEVADTDEAVRFHGSFAVECDDMVRVIDNVQRSERGVRALSDTWHANFELVVLPRLQSESIM